MTGAPGVLLRLVHNEKLAFLAVGAANTLIGLGWFALFNVLIGPRWGYMWVLPPAHVLAVLCAFVLYRKVVFRVQGHLWRDLWRFESVYLSGLAVNALLLPVGVELLHLPVMVSQILIVFVTALISWFGHKYFSFRRPSGPTLEMEHLQ